MTIDLWRALIGAIIGMGTFAIFARIAAGRPTQVQPAAAEGIMTVSRIYVGVSVIVMGGLGLVMLGPWFVGRSALPGLFCLSMALLSLTGLARVFRVTWDARGITTPAVFCGMPWPGKRRFISWDSLARAGCDILGNQFVMDTFGQKLRWNFSYRGHRALMRAVAAYRPDLF